MIFGRCFTEEVSWREMEKYVDNILHSFGDRIARDVKQQIPPLPDMVECETCGCLLKRGRATKGKGEVRERVMVFNFYFQAVNSYGHPLSEEYVYTPYYCKVHAPKKDECGGETHV